MSENPQGLIGSHGAGDGLEPFSGTFPVEGVYYATPGHRGGLRPPGHPWTPGLRPGVRDATGKGGSGRGAGPILLIPSRPVPRVHLPPLRAFLPGLGGEGVPSPTRKGRSPRLESALPLLLTLWILWSWHCRPAWPLLWRRARSLLNPVDAVELACTLGRMPLRGGNCDDDDKDYY